MTTNNKLDVITTFVDGTLTVAIRTARDANVGKLAVLLRLTEMRKRLTGEEPDQESLSDIEGTQRAIDELNIALADRIHKAGVVERAAAGNVPA